MTTKLADEYEYIKCRLEEIQSERLQAIMGKPLEDAKPVEAPAEIDWTQWNTGGYGSYVG
jgi:hypothetical protein